MLPLKLVYNFVGVFCYDRVVVLEHI